MKNGKSRSRKTVEYDPSPWQDENFFFIAGYTSGGAPYGITWEEEAEIEKQEGQQPEMNLPEDEDLPFV